ncbi:T9SS type A sorting domain-containing protein [bacterium SCSIO 12741]|nr:T9SS type A sorting domain-containing protein [bacterium SCSIO 12741]
MCYFKPLGLSLLGCILTFSIYSQTYQLPDGKGEPPSDRLYFRENLGQVCDPNFDSVPRVKFACTGTPLDLYLLDSTRISWVHLVPALDSLAPDSLRRLDMFHVNNDEITSQVFSSPVGWDSLPGEDNFWLPQCPQGVTGVRSFNRVVYPDIYPQIDEHIYSNAGGYKLYWVIHPGGDPADIRVKFEGYDLMNVTPQQITLFQNQLQIALEQAIAYQVDANGQVLSLNWQPGYTQFPDHTVGITIGAFDPAKMLVIQAGPPIPLSTPSISGNPDGLEWSTYVSTSLNDEPLGLFQSNQGFTYMVGHTGSSAFPIFLNTPQRFQGNQDAFIGSFTDLGEKFYGNYYGGRLEDRFTCGEVLPNGEILVAGHTKSDSLRNLGKNPSLDSNDYTGVLVRFNAQLDQPIIETYIGGEENDEIYDLDYAGNNEVIIVGKTNTPQGKFPLARQTSNSSYYQIMQSDDEGFIGRYNVNNFNLSYGSYFGGGYDDAVTAVEHDGEGNYYIAGYTKTKDGLTGSCVWPHSNLNLHRHLFPVCDKSGNSYIQANGKGNWGHDYFIAALNDQDEMQWSTFLGSDWEEITDPSLAIDPNDSSQVYLGGTTKDPSTFPGATTSNGYQWVPTVSNPGQGVIVRFKDRQQIEWRTFVGCNDANSFSSVEDLEFVPGVGLYVTGSTTCNQPQSRANYGTPPTGSTFVLTDNDQELWLQEDTNGNAWQKGSQDSYIQAYSRTDRLAWSSWYGGGAGEQKQLISYNSGTDRVFISGGINPDPSNTIPLKKPNPSSYLQSNVTGHGGQTGGYLARFESGFTPVSVAELTSEFARFTVWPNPSSTLVHVELEEEAEFEVYSLTGQRVLSGRLTASVNAIHVEALAQGSYVVRVRSQTKSGSFKLIKE